VRSIYNPTKKITKQNHLLGNIKGKLNSEIREKKTTKTKKYPTLLQLIVFYILYALINIIDYI